MSRLDERINFAHIVLGIIALLSAGVIAVGVWLSTVETKGHAAEINAAQDEELSRQRDRINAVVAHEEAHGVLLKSMDSKLDILLGQRQQRR